MPRVGIVIPSFRAEAQLHRCLSAIAQQDWGDHQTFVRDNNTRNVYYTAAINEGIVHFYDQPGLQYVLALNQDAYLAPDALRQLVGFMDARPDCGIACPLQLATKDGRTQVSWGGSKAAFPVGVHQGRPLAEYGAAFETPWANGACMLIRRDTLREAGLLDRNLRFLYSDSDYSFTVRARGWKVFVVPAARVEHQLSASSAPPGVSELERIKVADMQYFARKWLTGDLYRSLAFEGASLTEEFLREHMRKIAYTLERMDAQLAGAPPPR